MASPVFGKGLQTTAALLRQLGSHAVSTGYGLRYFQTMARTPSGRFVVKPGTTYELCEGVTAKVVTQDRRPDEPMSEYIERNSNQVIAELQEDYLTLVCFGTIIDAPQEEIQKIVDTVNAGKKAERGLTPAQAAVVKPGHTALYNGDGGKTRAFISFRRNPSEDQASAIRRDMADYSKQAQLFAQVVSISKTRLPAGLLERMTRMNEAAQESVYELGASEKQNYNCATYLEETFFGRRTGQNSPLMVSKMIVESLIWQSKDTEEINKGLALLGQLAFNLTYQEAAQLQDEYKAGVPYAEESKVQVVLETEVGSPDDSARATDDDEYHADDSAHDLDDYHMEEAFTGIPGDSVVGKKAEQKSEDDHTDDQDEEQVFRPGGRG